MPSPDPPTDMIGGGANRWTRCPASAHCPGAQRLTMARGQSLPSPSLHPEGPTQAMESQLSFPRRVVLGPSRSSPNSSRTASPARLASCLESPSTFST